MYSIKSPPPLLRNVSHVHVRLGLKEVGRRPKTWRRWSCELIYCSEETVGTEFPLSKTNRRCGLAQYTTLLSSIPATHLDVSTGLESEGWLHTCPVRPKQSWRDATNPPPAKYLHTMHGATADLIALRCLVLTINCEGLFCLACLQKKKKKKKVVLPLWRFARYWKAAESLLKQVHGPGNGMRRNATSEKPREPLGEWNVTQTLQLPWQISKRGSCTTKWTRITRGGGIKATCAWNRNKWINKSVRAKAASWSWLYAADGSAERRLCTYQRRRLKDIWRVYRWHGCPLSKSGEPN